MKRIDIPTKSPGDQVSSDEFNMLTEAANNTVEYLNGLDTSQVKHGDVTLGVQIGRMQDSIGNCTTKNIVGALATGNEQRLVVRFIDDDNGGVLINIPGAYYNLSTKMIEIYERQGEGWLSIVQRVLNEPPSKNVVYCDAATNKLYRWDGDNMIQVGGSSLDTYTKTEIDDIIGNIETLLASI